MIIDDNIADLIMARKTLKEEYDAIPMSSGILAQECLNDMPELPDLVLLDVDMPNVNRFQVISKMKNIPKLVNRSLNNLVQEKNKKNLELQYSIVAMFVDLLTKRDGFAG